MLLLFCLLIFSQCADPAETPATSGPPNIILVVVDDLGWRDVGFMGSTYYETPHLDSLSQRSLVFTNGYAGAANCAPSRACLLSGQNTPRHGIYTVSPSDRGNKKTRKLIPTPNTKTLADSVLTLAEVLQSNGYATCSIGKWHVGDDPTTQGFDINVGGTHAGHPKTYFSPYQNPNLKDGPEGEYLTERLSSEAVHFIRNHREEPFFLYLPYFTIHTPLQGKPGLVDKYEGKKMSGGQGRNPHYAAMIETMDSGIGFIMRTLKSLQLEENTIIIFTSDNGGISYLSRQSPLRAGKGSYYEGGIRVPFMVTWPGRVEGGRKSDAPVTLMDVYPTVLDLLDLEKPADKLLDGISLKDHILEGDAIAERPLYWHFPIYLQAYRKGEDQSRDSLFRTRPGTVMRLGNWKLHEYFEDGALELYNLEDDLGETNDLSATNPEKAAELHQMMQTWRESTQAPVPTELNPDYDADFRPQGRR
ncbi:aryl-sulfate sulfohydrolase [Flavilitoribacter nigricans DSM 23189 = NBRC 102662]|uniref:Aryl-sulfate sulfohydrolase n=1 Tax=Flavilitoribacter nigricans (strain ATCC 23147 / DSM 23189 / NBRC 102662 / NCIMB 1420 / SS-2) TaxID=1122177 RepID=A0A2D0N2F1_FLAN2|nr:aryl-sulfate sulfohydrolase [Flavilitoribacter nigricans DSM 23189 = NBRC 102662]